jgi:hypothetical protein
LWDGCIIAYESVTTHICHMLRVLHVASEL